MSGPASELRIAVLVKQVPDINAVTVDAHTHQASVGESRVMNTYDAYAVSEAIGIRERFGGNVTVITAGPPSARDVLLRALATGADQAILIDFPGHNDVDSLELAGILAEVLTGGGFDLVLAGQSTDDYESGQVGPQVAEILNWPHVSLVTHVDADMEGGQLRVTRDSESAREVVTLPLPAVLMVLSGRDGEQRYPTLRGMMAAKKKPLDVVTVKDGDHDPDRIAWSTPVADERKAGGTIIEGTAADDAARQLVEWLRERKLL